MIRKILRQLGYDTEFLVHVPAVNCVFVLVCGTYDTEGPNDGGVVPGTTV